MPKKNFLLESPPYAVETSLKKLGNNLRIARLRRNWTIAEMAEKIGTGIRAVSEAEKGNPSTSIVIYMAMLWAFDFLDQVESIADSVKDTVGQRLAALSERKRARKIESQDNDF